MRLLITGSRGFVGSHVVARCRKQGIIVFGTSRKRSGKNVYKIDSTDFSQLNSFMRTKNITACIHLAGESIVEEGQENPHKTFSTNIQGALNVLEASARNNLMRVIIASTSHVYGSTTVPYHEDDLLHPTRPYETSKACIDLIAASYAETYGLPVLIPRFVNIYGPGDLNFSRIIPKTIRSVLRGENPEMWGDGKIIRDYLYIDDVVDAYMKLLTVDKRKIPRSTVLNFGSDSLISVKKLINRIISLSGKRLRIKHVTSPRDAEIKRQYVSWKKAQQILGWHPTVDLDEGIAITIDWYRRYLNRK